MIDEGPGASLKRRAFCFWWLRVQSAGVCFRPIADICPPWNIHAMTDRLVVLVSALLLTGCTNFQQYVYNCTDSPIHFATGFKVGPKSYFGRRTGLPPFTVNDYALFPDGTYKAPLRVSQEGV
jgi:hypothetical protein